MFKIVFNKNNVDNNNSDKNYNNDNNIKNSNDDSHNNTNNGGICNDNVPVAVFFIPFFSFPRL